MRNKEDYNLYDEIFYIKNNYMKVKSNPNIKVKKNISVFKKNIFLFLLLAIFSNMLYNYDCLILSLFGIIIFIYLLIEYNKKFKILVKEQKNTIFKVNFSEKGIKYLNENKILKWENIIAITINKYSICMLPKDYPINEVMYWRINQKEEIIKKLKKYNKLNLLVDNQCNLK